MVALEGDAAAVQAFSIDVQLLKCFALFSFTQFSINKLAHHSLSTPGVFIRDLLLVSFSVKGANDRLQDSKVVPMIVLPTIIP